jgi:ATP-dependent helicase/nuclease subunit A
MSNERQLADQRARDRIVSDLDRNLLVEAGAGSGKTHEMARRMAAGVATGVYQVEHMSAVTFTRKAAAELRGRFQLALEDQLGQSAARPDAADRIARIRAALSNLERFFAGTIHAFCAHVLRERPVEAGVSPGFTELDEVADARLRKQSWRDFLTASKADPVVSELREANVKPKDLDGAFETVCLYEEVEFPPGDAVQPDTAAGFKALDTFWAALCRKLPKAIDPDATCPTQKKARAFVWQMRLAHASRARPGTLAALLATWDFEPGITQKCWADDVAAKKKIAAEITALHGTFRTGVIQPFLAAWRQYIYRLSITLLATARAHASRERRRRNALNYGDLLQLAARVLRGNAEVRRALQEKYRWLFVDEFQDTDPVQAEIVFLLAAQAPDLSALAPVADGAGPADWRSIPLRPGALFVVGDPKQSIYRFRRADIDIYNVVRDRLTDPRSGQVLSLTTNFRSAPALCQWANDVFRGHFPSEPTAYSPRFAPLDSHRDAPAATPGGGQTKPPRGIRVGSRPGSGPGASDQTAAGASGIRTLTIPASVDQRHVPAAEAGQIARFIRSEIDAHRRSFGDFLVLTRKRKHLTLYVEALEALHVPVEVSGAGAFGDSDEVAQLALLLRALSDPQDGVALVGVLRGPLFGISDQALFAFRQAGGWLSIFNQPVSGATAAVAGALDALHQMFRWTRLLPAGAALERILEQTGYLALAATTAGGVEAGDLLHAIDRVRQVAEDGLSLAAAASALEDDREASSEVESLPLEPGRGDVVRVMNLHKAKGLEAAVVFLADPCGGFKPRVNIRIIRDGLVARGYFSITTDWGRSEKVLAEPAAWAQFKEEEQTYLAAEEHRLLYVSATRARDLLVIGRWAKSGSGGVRAWEAFAPSLSGAAELVIPGAVSAPAAQVVDLSAAAHAQAAALRDAAHRLARVPSWTATSVTAEAGHIATIAPAVDGDAGDPTCAVVGGTPSHRADAGMAWGTLIHGLLEHAMRHKTVTRVDLRRLAIWLTVEEPQLRPVIDDAIDTVEAVAAADFWGEAKAATECHEETPFGVLVKDAAVPQVLNGTIDLVYRATDGWCLIDYKTDTDGGRVELQSRYSGQIAAYERAWRRFDRQGVTSVVVSTRSTKA